MILDCQNISKTFPENIVLNHVSFHMENNEKAALVGPNGIGKSTLLKIIVGELTSDEGQVIVSRDTSIGYLAQHQNIDTDNTIWDELFSVRNDLLQLEQQIRDCEASMKHLSGDALSEAMELYSTMTHRYELEDGYAYKSRVIGILKGLGFTEDEFSKPIHVLSGGQKTRVALGRLLLLAPDIILLDEPTNHLDMDSIKWLETYLQTYQGAVLLVSHDRFFLDRTVNKIFEIDHSHVTTFTGNYSDYSRKKEIIKTSMQHAYENQQRQIHHQEEVIEKLRSFNREKSIKRADSRQKLLDKVDLLDQPDFAQKLMNLTLSVRTTSGNDVLHAEDLSKAFDSEILFSGLTFDIHRQERVAIIGANGTGKTTLLKIINGVLDPDQGSVTLGTNVQIGYYDQEQQVLDDTKTIFEEISDAYPTLTNTEIRNVLAAFLFTGDDVFKSISALSGGERGRVSLAKLMLSSANFLILDEPTNHLDIFSKEVLEHALSRYEGTVLYVSHDRYFINQTCTRILDLTGTRLVDYGGNYDYYLEKQETRNDLSTENASTISAEIETDAKLDWKQQKAIAAEIRRKEQGLANTEAAITEHESQIGALNERLEDPSVACDSAKCSEIMQQLALIKDELDDLYETWGSLSDG